MKVISELEKAVKNGDSKKIEKCFEYVYKAYANLIFVFISKYINRKEDIEELTDDVFIQFFNHLDNINFEKNIKYYLMKTAKNLTINFIKRNNIEKIFVDDNELMNYKVENDNNSYHHLINKWKRYLSIEEIDIILKHILEGYELKEIAKIKNKSPNTIKSTYRRAIKKLQKQKMEDVIDE